MAIHLSDKILKGGHYNEKSNFDWKPVSLSFKNTDAVFDEIKKALEEV